MIHTCNPKKTTFSRGRRGRVGWGHLWDLFYCEDVPGVRWANADHWDLPQDVAQTMTDSNWEVSTWLLFANSPKLSCMRLKIEVKEEPWGQTSVKGKTVDKIILTEVSQTEKEKKNSSWTWGTPSRNSLVVCCVWTRFGSLLPVLSGGPSTHTRYPLKLGCRFTY